MMFETVQFEGPNGENCLTVKGGMHSVPRVGDSFKVEPGKQYVVKSVEHTISADLKNHLIWIHLQ
jgi:hypothetical protein